MKIGIILGSTRDTRSGERVGKFVEANLAKRTDVEHELLDLKAYPMPFFADAMPPGMRQGLPADPIAAKWAAKIAEMDGFIIITPEYNHGYPAVLKNALDFLYHEWLDKPVGFVSYSIGPTGGARAVEQLRQVVANLSLIDIREAVAIGMVNQVLDEKGVPSTPLDSFLDKVVEQLLGYMKVLKEKREKA